MYKVKHDALLLLGEHRAAANRSCLLLISDTFLCYLEYEMLKFRDVLSGIADEVSTKYTIRSDQHLRPLMLAYCLGKSLVVDKSFRAITTYRLKNYAFQTRKNRLLTLVGLIDGLVNGIDISYAAKIGLKMRLPHPQCIVIGNATIGNNVTIYQNVTLGATWDKEKNGQKFPIIGDDVRISAGAKIIGPVRIGNNAIIGANAVVIKDVPENCVAVGNPARVIKRKTGLEKKG